MKIPKDNCKVYFISISLYLIKVCCFWIASKKWCQSNVIEASLA